MDGRFSAFISLIYFIVVFVAKDTFVNAEDSGCGGRCQAYRLQMARFSFSKVYLDNLYLGCVGQCTSKSSLVSNQGAGAKRPTPVIQTTRKPATRKPFVWPQPATRKPFVWPQPTTKKPFVWPQPTTKKPFVWPQPTTKKPFVWPQPTTKKPFVWPQPTTKKPFVWPQPTTKKPFVWPQPATKKPFVWPQPTTRKPFVWPQPITRKPFVWPQPTTKTPFVWPQPTTKKPFVWPQPATKKPFVWPQPTTRKPFKKPQLTGCGMRRNFNSRIIGGTFTQGCEFPWMVNIDVPNTMMCGGTILDNRHILTGAHCLRDPFRSGRQFDARDIKVKVGSTILSNMITINVKSSHVHPQYDDVKKDYDIGIITLEQDLVFGQCIGPICLPEVNQKAEDMNECYSAGWGKTNTDHRDRRPSQYLLKAKLPVANHDVCRRNYARLGIRAMVNDLKFCAGNNAAGLATCNGDSGGPLMCRNGNGPFFEFGIVSFGRNTCAIPGYPDVFTKVSHPKVMEYILETIKDV